MVCNGYVAGRIAASRGLATFSNLEMQHSPKIFCIFLQKVLAKNNKDGTRQPGLNISAKGFSVYVTESTPLTLLAAVLEVIQDAE